MKTVLLLCALCFASNVHSGPLDWAKKGVAKMKQIAAGTKDGNGDCGTVTGVVGDILDPDDTAAATDLCLLGKDLRDLLSDEDVEELAKSTEKVIATGEDSSFEGSETGVNGKITVTSSQTTKQTSKVPALKKKVHEMPPLELVGAEYLASSTVNVRGGPGTDYEVVGALEPQQRVQVIGRVEGEPWYLIGQGGVATGFVHQDLLDPTGQIGGSAEAPAGEIAEIEVATDVTCRTMEQQITLADGTVRTEEIRACQKPDGSWEVT